MSDPRETLARIRAQAAAATEGPWWTNRYSDDWEVCGEFDDNGNPALIASEAAEDDAEFIAAARTTVPALLDALEAVLVLHCPDHVESRDLCASCFGWDSEPVLWPCPTVKAITDALSGRPTANGSGEYLARIHEAALDPDHIAASAKVAPSFTWATDGEDPTNR